MLDNFKTTLDEAKLNSFTFNKRYEKHRVQGRNSVIGNTQSHSGVTSSRAVSELDFGANDDKADIKDILGDNLNEDDSPIPKIRVSKRGSHNSELV